MAFGKHELTPSELWALLAAEREGAAFLAFRQADVTVGRSTQADLAFETDTQMSRTHAELSLVGADWTVSDDGLSRNGSFITSNASRAGGA